MAATGPPFRSTTVAVRRRRLPGLVACLLLAVHAGLLAWSALRHSPTQDEVAHLPAGLAAWRFGDPGLYRVNPPLVRSIAALPMLFVDHEEDWAGYQPGAPQRQEWRIGAQFIRANGERSWRLVTLARWTCIPFSLLGGLICWRWGTSLSGPVGGLTALALWCFSPNILGHGALITPDVAAVASGALAAWCFESWREKHSIGNAFSSGLALGLALLTKTYWIILLMLWPLFALVDAYGRSGTGDDHPKSDGGVEKRRDQKRRTSIAYKRGAILGQVVLALAVGLNVLNLGYGFVGTGTPLGKLPFFSRLLAGETRHPERDEPANRFAGTFAGTMPIPVPADWICGVDVQKADFEVGKWSYLLGQARETGWWHYYLVGLAVKVPLGTWLLALLGLGTMLRYAAGRWRFGRLAPLWMPACIIFVLASSQTGVHRHVRYVFPVLPVLYLLAGHSVATALGEAAERVESGEVVGACRRRHPHWKSVVPAILLLYSVLSSLSQYPHSLSYFNELAGGPAGGHRVLVDSNIDWGQDLSLVKDWLKAHPTRRPLCVAWLGFYDLRDVGLHVPQVNPDALDPGWYIVSVHLLHEPRGRYRRFLQMGPVDRIGYSMNVYRVANTGLSDDGGQDAPGPKK